MMSRDKEKSNKKKGGNKISRKNNNLSRQSVKRKIPLWLQDSPWPNKKNKNVKERRCKHKWRNKDFSKLKRNL